MNVDLVDLCHVTGITYHHHHHHHNNNNNNNNNNNCYRPNETNHGVPFYCLHPICPHNRSNKYFHSFYMMETLGELGYHFFDVHRNIIFGFASILTLLSTALFLFGVAAFSDQQEVISASNWASLQTEDISQTQYIYYKIQFGLRAMVINACDSDTSDFTKCKVKSINYSDDSCSKLGFIGDICTVCGAAATSEATGAAFTAISKLLALGGMQRRMYTVADSPSFKLYAICVEIIGIVSLITSLGEFEAGCIRGTMDLMSDPTKKYHNNLVDSRSNLGSAFIAYAFGAIAAGIRLIIHVLTPLPRRGKGLITPLYKLFTRCDGCGVLYVDEEEDEKRRSALGIKHIPTEATTEATEARPKPERSSSLIMGQEIGDVVEVIGSVNA